MAASRRLENTKPIAPVAAETARPIQMACVAATAAPRGFFSPTRRATMAVVAIERPMATLYTTMSIASVSPTAATASAPSRATKNTSTMPNSDSMLISRIMGMESSVMARPRLPSV